MMHKTEIVDVSDQVHAHPKRLETMSGMTRATSQIRQALTEGGIEAFDKSGVEGRPPTRALQQRSRVSKQSMRFSGSY